MSTSILQPWVTELGLRHQGVLVAAIRGCDGMTKEDATKPIARELRGLVLVPFDPRELEYDKGFMTKFPSDSASKSMSLLCKSLDHYPVHYLFHLIHAIEIVGYYHPDMWTRAIYRDRYNRLVRKLHRNPETEQQCRERLTEDRIASNTVE